MTTLPIPSHDQLEGSFLPFFAEPTTRYGRMLGLPSMRTRKVANNAKFRDADGCNASFGGSNELASQHIYPIGLTHRRIMRQNQQSHALSVAICLERE